MTNDQARTDPELESTSPADHSAPPISQEQLIGQCWFLVGATASGKTGVSLALAERLNAEIVSMDSMAIYRYMDVGTAKPSAEQRQETPHHLIDILDPDQTFSTSDYHRAALAASADILSRGKTVIFVGGTALYLKALLRGLFQGPPADWDFRKEVERDVETMGGEFLHQRLQMVDPVSAHQLHPNDHRRIIRALEVYKITGKPISHLQMEFDEATPADRCRVYALRHDRAILHKRIESRVTTMFEKGLLDEVKQIQSKFSGLSHTASQAVGYKEAFACLAGEMTTDEAIEKVRIRTRRFARHQETWFRGMTECTMVDLAKDFTVQAIVEELLERGSQVQG